MFDLLGSKDEERTQSWKHYHYGSSDILKVIGEEEDYFGLAMPGGTKIHYYMQ